MSAPTAGPERVGVLGGGRMGAGIAHAFLTTGSRVIVLERDQPSAEAARARVLDAVASSVARGTLSEPVETVEARLSVTVERADFADVDLVVEAVPEDENLKRDALSRIAAVVGSNVIIASNTSSMSIGSLSSSVENPERFLGMHFFNPVPASTLVEIVVGENTSEATTAAVQAMTEVLGKTPITVRDVPGFASSRLGVAIALEAMRMLEDGVASAEDIDAAMVLGYRFPMGPLRLTDVVGLDVRLGIAEYLSAELGERFAPPQILREMVAAGNLGRKSGRGFFDWSK